MMKRWLLVWLAWAVLLLHPPDVTAAINTDGLAKPWPKQRTRQYEVWRYNVRWRERLDKKEGIFAGVQFEAPLDRQAVWTLSSDYGDVGATVSGVTAVRYLERSPAREVIQIDVKILWKSLTLTIEVEQEPPRTLRFRFVNNGIVDYLGVCTFEERMVSVPGKPPAPATVVELSTWLKPGRPVPMRLLLIVERTAMLNATKMFLKECERKGAPPHQPAVS